VVITFILQVREPRTGTLATLRCGVMAGTSGRRRAQVWRSTDDADYDRQMLHQFVWTQ
jgi:hypothetical protein